MQLVCGNADLCAEAKLPTVGETRARIPVDRGTVHLGEETLGRGFVTGDDPVTVVRSMVLNVRHSLVQGIHHFERKDQVEKLRAEIISRRADHLASADARKRRKGAIIAAQLHTLLE